LLARGKFKFRSIIYSLENMAPMLTKVVIAALALIGFVSAFAPSAPAPRMTMSAQTRGAFLKNAGIAVGVGASALIPSVAFADGAVSSATVQRARGVYGQRVAALKDAVAKGDFGAVLDEKNIYLLYTLYIIYIIISLYIIMYWPR